MVVYYVLCVGDIRCVGYIGDVIVFEDQRCVVVICIGWIIDWDDC